MSRRAVSERLASLGLEVDAEAVLTAPMAAALWLASEGIARATLLLPRSTFEDFDTVEAVPPDASPEAVVVGDLGPEFTFERLNGAYRALRAGARLVAIHKNRFWLPAAGPTLDAGAFVVALEYAAGVEAILVGKPSPTFFALAVERLGVPRATVAVVGDDPEGDVLGARRAGLIAVQVRTGKGAAAPRPSDETPDIVLDSVSELSAVFTRPRRVGWRC